MQIYNFVIICFYCVKILLTSDQFHIIMFDKIYMLSINNLKKGSFRNRGNLLFKKTANSISFGLFMRTNGKCNDSHCPLAPA